MGQIIYEEMGLEEVLARCKIVLIAKLIEANGKMRVRQVEGAPDAPFEYQCATWQVRVVLGISRFVLSAFNGNRFL